MNQDGILPLNTSTENRFQYNGKELEKDGGIDLSDYGARWYDGSVGRFTGVDPIADEFAWVSPFNYAENEPVRHIDLWGLQKYYKPNGEFFRQIGDDESIMILPSNFWATDADIAGATPAYTMDQEDHIMKEWAGMYGDESVEYTMSLFSKVLYDQEGRYEDFVFVKGSVGKGRSSSVGIEQSKSPFQGWKGWRRFATIHNHPNGNKELSGEKGTFLSSDYSTAVKYKVNMYVVAKYADLGRKFTYSTYAEHDGKSVSKHWLRLRASSDWVLDRSSLNGYIPKSNLEGLYFRN